MAILKLGNNNSEFSGSFSGSYVGDGSQLTGIDPFPFIGDASITGSLEISGSLKMIRPSNKLDLSIGSNIIVGREAGNSISDDRSAIFLGYKAGYTNTSPTANIAIGYGAGGSLGTNASQQNIFMGYLAGAGNTSIGSITSRMSAASNNIGMGYQALLYLTSGDQNIALGAAVMRNISTGGNNTALGAYALYNTDSGDNNIGIGYYAGFNQTSGDGNITIGSGSLGIAGESNQLRIGNGNSLVTISASLETGEILLNTTTISGSLLNSGTVSLDNTDSPYTITGTQQFILIDPSGGDVTINLPDAATYPGREIKLKLTQNSGANTVTLQCQGADTIDGAASNTTDLEDIYEAISIVSNGGTSWFIF